MRFLYAVTLLLAVAGSALAQDTPLPPDPIDAAFSALAAKAAQNGQVRVIVTLDAGFVPEGDQPLGGVQAQRDGIQSEQVSLLARLQSPTEVTRFRFTPAMALTVSAADLARLRQSPEVVAIQEDEAVAPYGAVPAAPPMIAARRLDDSVVLVGATAAWSAGFDGTGYEVAVLDTGVQSDHPFLSGKVVAEGCFSTTSAGNGSTSVCPNGTNPAGPDSQVGPGAGADCDQATQGPGCNHGTHVAGIAAGRQTDGAGPAAGVARGAGIIAVQVFTSFDEAVCGAGQAPCVRSYNSDVLRGLEYVFDLVVNGGRQVASANLSLGGGRSFTTCDTDVRKAIIDNLASVGVATVISSGNDGFQDSGGSPGCISSAVTVGSTTKTDAVSGFSNVPPFLDLFAPGSSIRSSVPTDQYAFFNGTSMSAPHVAGAFAILKQRFPQASVEDLLQRLQTSGVPIRAGSPKATYRRIQIDAAFLNDPAFAIAPTSVSALVATGGQASRVVTLSNTAPEGSLGLTYEARLQNVQEADGTPLTNACEAGQELVQSSATFATTNTPTGFKSGQSFTVPCTGTMASISPELFNTGSLAVGSTFSATLRVFRGAGTGGTEVSARAFTANNPPQGTRGFLTIPLPTAISVVAGETYTWFFDITEGSNQLLGVRQQPVCRR